MLITIINKHKIYLNKININENFKLKSSLNFRSSKCNYDLNGPKIYCAVLTHYGNLDTKAMSVNKTWGNYTILKSEKLLRK